MSSVARYESFLVHNASTISGLESTLRSLSWLLPGRFKDAELATELLSASLNVLSMYHDTILSRIVNADPKHKPLLPSSQHSRYTRSWTESSQLYRWAARTLELIRFTELLVEMGLRRKVSVKVKWRAIVLIETIKALLRLLILRITRRPLVSPLIPEREYDPSTLPPSGASSPTLAPSSPPDSAPATPEHLKNNHVPLPLHPLLLPSAPGQSAEDYLLSKALTTSAVRSPVNLVKPLTSLLEWVAEIIYICRPLVYAAMLARDRRSSRPMTTLVALEILSRNLRRTPSPSSSLERSEYARRDRDILWYLLRGRIWQSYTRPKLDSFAEKASHSSFLSIAGGLVKDWLPLIDEYYYYSAP
ncbi:peroxisome membrane protein [Punctularia strigosozonata HHB-11173 SS5]|uniref:peroxisome membrane protein n=1 Tax=Punctularia strigosozonata (strain HHB-11173) TaxID=741275 RepID=UPI0004417D3E|nr:peroxisome membrane protein [Punctularia strigosozonata HHB-11173 SS5]EIN13791.1 peroxisome membrane protein [Punctularia strigosozonata HHB-11173 SS5]